MIVNSNSELLAAITNVNVTKISLGKDLESKAEIKRKVDLDLNGKVLTGDVSFVTSSEGTITLGKGILKGNLTVNTPNISFVNEANIEGTTTIADVKASTFTNNGVLKEVIILDNNGTRFVNGQNATAGKVTLDAKDAPILLEGTITDLNVIQPATVTITGKVENLESNVAVSLKGEGTVTKASGTGTVTLDEEVKIIEGAYENTPPTISNARLFSDGDNRINVSLQVNEEIDFSKKADIRIAYFKEIEGKLTPVKTTSGTALVKYKDWSGYLNGPNNEKYSKGYMKNEAYINIVKANTLLLTTVDPKYLTMDYVNEKWTETPGELVVEITVFDNAGNKSEVNTIRLEK